ncbi:hypothetical protein [Amycolatopsis sp. NPDC054798]
MILSAGRRKPVTIKLPGRFSPASGGFVVMRVRRDVRVRLLARIEQAGESTTVLQFCGSHCSCSTAWRITTSACAVPLATARLRLGRRVIEHVKSRSAWFKGPKTAAFGELPNMSAGKIQKFELRSKAGKDAEHREQRRVADPRM